jgi:hypothetical protein
MTEQFEEFLGHPNRIKRDRPRVTLNKKGYMLLNANAFRSLDEPAAVKFYYDGIERIIGLRSADIRIANAFPLRNKDKSHHTIYAAPLCRHYGINPPGTILFNDIEIDHTGLLKLDLKTATTIRRGSS